MDRPRSTQRAPEYLDSIFSHVEYYVHRFGLTDFDLVLWLLRQRFQSTYIDDNIDKVCKVYAKCVEAANQRGESPRPESLFGPLTRPRSIVMLPDYMQGWVKVRVFEAKKPNRKPTLYWVTLDGPNVFFHKGVTSSPSTKPAFVLSQDAYVNKLLADNTFCVFVPGTAVNKTLNSQFRNSVKRVEYEMTSSSEHAVEMWINAFTCVIGATSSLSGASSGRPDTTPLKVLPAACLSQNSWNFLSPTNPVIAAAKDLCQWHFLVRMCNVDVGEGHGDFDSQLKPAGSSTKPVPRVLCYITVSVFVPPHSKIRPQRDVPANQAAKIDAIIAAADATGYAEDLGSAQSNDKPISPRSRKLKKVADKISRRKAARNDLNAAAMNAESVDATEQETHDVVGDSTWRVVHQTHAVPLREMMTWGAATVLELPRNSIENGAKVCLLAFLFAFCLFLLHIRLTFLNNPLCLGSLYCLVR